MSVPEPSPVRPAHPMPADYHPTPGLLAGRTILVTGASGGLGAASALACAKLGATTILLGRDVPALERVYDRIVQASAPQPAIYPMDLAGAKWSDYAALAKKCREAFGRLDGLVAAAAHFRAFMPLSQMPPGEWAAAVQVNLTAAYALTAHCVPLLQKSFDASAVFVVDGDGEAPRAYSGAYGVTKYALRGMAHLWAEELAFRTHMRFNCYDPGPMRTQQRARGYPSEGADAIPPPEAAVPPLMWLLGPESRGLTGEDFRNPAAGPSRA
ncbi:MAG TPA: SDR family NAD(P)-dependent oxidoreductase [Nevskiaceae bacterium]